MSDITGPGVKDPNIIYRICLLVFCGVLAAGAVLYWREELYSASAYQPLPVTHQQIKIVDANRAEQKLLQQQLTSN